jgi:SAM-dependent methyltransferase
VYLALPSEPDLTRVRSVLRPDSSVLDLGAGVGRIANALTAEGHRVVAVDDSVPMLEHVAGAEAVLADVWTLDLHRRFDAVLALSHLINHRARERRLGLLGVCRRHLRDAGVVVVQRYPPDWKPADETTRVGDVEIHLHDLRALPDGFAATVTYAIGDRSWAQSFEATTVDDEELRSLAEGVGLVFGRALDEHGAWVLLTTP